MSNECKNCKKATIGERQFCSPLCRNLWVSDFMVKKSKKIKKDIGNTYYAKKKKL